MKHDLLGGPDPAWSVQVMADPKLAKNYRDIYILAKFVYNTTE